MDPNDRVYVAGGDTLIGSAIVRRLRRNGFAKIAGGDIEEPDYRDAAQVEAFYDSFQPDYVFIAAGKSGGIRANQTFPADFMLDSLLVANNLIPAAFRAGVKKLLYLGSSCSYPRLCAQPMKEADLFGGPVEPTNDAYATAKRAGIKLCQAYRAQYGAPFITAIPANAFGPHDHFEFEGAHVVAALTRRMHDAKNHDAPCIDVWGTGQPRREFIFVDDLADACLFVMEEYNGAEPINLGSGHAVTIASLAESVKAATGYAGEIHFDTERPDGMPEKALDNAKLTALGWKASTPFDEALRKTYAWFEEQLVHV